MILFGSRARGDFKRTSDIDIAASGGDFDRFALDVDEEKHGFAEGATDSPKMILKTAYKAGMIKDEELWLSALQERNNVTHSYNRKIAMGIITQAKQKFYKMFCELKEEIDRNWI